jgi:hypothetical protein
MVERLVSASSTRSSTISSRLRADVFSLDDIEDSLSRPSTIFRLRFVDLFFAESVLATPLQRIHHRYGCACDVLSTSANTGSDSFEPFLGE